MYIKKKYEYKLMSVSLVSCYYKLPSKHSHSNYDSWIKNLLKNINSNIIIFTSKDLIEYLENIGNHNKNMIIIEKELETMPLVQKYDDEFWKNQEKIDKNKKCGRTKYCFQIWNSKFDFLKLAIEMNPFNSDKFIWNDIGSMRDNNYCKNLVNYPNYDKVSKDKLDIVLLRDYNNTSQMFFEEEMHLSGAMFGGGKEIILELHKLFYIYFEIYVKSNRFIGCDQQIMSTLFLKNRESFNEIIPINPIVNKWFYLYYYYDE